MNLTSPKTIFYIAGFNSGGPALTPIRMMFKTQYEAYKTYALSSSSTQYAWKNKDRLLQQVIKHRVDLIKSTANGSDTIFIAHSLGCIEMLRDLKYLFHENVFSGRTVDLVLVSPPNILQSGNKLFRLIRMFFRFIHMQRNLAKYELKVLEQNVSGKKSKNIDVSDNTYYTYLNCYIQNGYADKSLMDKIILIDQKIKGVKPKSSIFFNLVNEKKRLLSSFMIGLYHGKHVLKKLHINTLKEYDELHCSLTSKLFFLLNYPVGFFMIISFLKDIDLFLPKLTNLAYEKSVKLSIRFVFLEEDQLVKLSDKGNLKILEDKFHPQTKLHSPLIFGPSSHSTLIYNTKILREILKRYLV